MADLDRRTARYDRRDAPAQTRSIEGLRAYMLRVYNYMAAGLAITGLVAYLVALRSPSWRRRPGCPAAHLDSDSSCSPARCMWVLIFAPLALGVLHVRAHP